MNTKNTQSLFQKDLVNEALKQALIKLDPSVMIKNPIMFLVEVGTVVMLVVSLWTLMGEKSQGSFGYNFTIHRDLIACNAKENISQLHLCRHFLNGFHLETAFVFEN